MIRRCDRLRRVVKRRRITGGYWLKASEDKRDSPIVNVRERVIDAIVGDR